MCGSDECNHYNMIDEKFVDKDNELQKLKGKWQSKDVEDFKDILLEKNRKALLEDGMY